MVTIVSLPILLTGCSTQRISDYRPASASVSERTAQESGVEVAIDPFVDSKRTKQYFDIDAVADGIAIVHVRVANSTADRTYLVEKKDFHLIPNGAAAGWAGDGKKIERDRAAGTATEWAAVATVGSLAGSGLLLAGLALESKATEIQRNFTSKEIADATLSPGKSMEGFVYFTPVKKGEDWSRATTVKINLTETKTQQMITLTIPLSH
jgi:hypothetical protein